MEYVKKIEKEELNQLPIKFFKGAIHLVSNMDEFYKILPKLSMIKEYGFDTETRPSFKKGTNHKVALLQLSTVDEAFLFRLNKMGLPDELLEILADRNKIKVGAAIRDDIKALKAIKEYTQAGFVDLQIMVKELGFESFSLKKLSALVLGFRISKSQQLSNWEANELTPQQLTYAATDAWVSLKIYKGLLNNR